MRQPGSLDGKPPSLRPQPGGPAILAGRTVSRIGYGAMQLPRLKDEPAQAHALIRHAVDIGIDHFDTAQFYGNGLVNELLGRALRADDDVLISSKVGADANPAGPMHIRLAQRPEQLRASVEDNLQTLGVTRIHIVNLRRPDDRPGLRAEADQRVDLDDQLAELMTLRDEGKIGGVGLSNVTLDEVEQALPSGLACVQNAYSLLARSDDDVLALCEAEGIAWVPFFPLGSAAPHLPKVTDVPAVQDIATALGRTPAQIGLAWLLHRSPNIFLIPGTADVRHLDTNAAAGSIEFTDAQLASLDITSTT